MPRNGRTCPGSLEVPKRRRARGAHRGYASHWRINLEGLGAADPEACKHAVSAARDAGRVDLLTLHLVRAAYLHCLEGEYALAVAAAEEGTQLAFEIGDGFDYMLAHFWHSWALFHQGEFGAMEEVVRRGEAFATKNDQRLWIHLFAISKASGRIQTGQPEEAAELCRAALEFSRENRGDTGQIYFKSSIVLALALIASQRIAEASAVALEAHRAHQDGASFMDHILDLPLQYVLTECLLGSGNTDQSMAQAVALVGAAEHCGEATYEQLGSCALARAQAATGKTTEALETVRASLQRWPEERAPVSRWRLYALLADLHEKLGNKQEVARARARVAAILHEFASSLSAFPELRLGFEATSEYKEFCAG